MASQAASVNEAGSGITRREFLYYIWGASIALLTVQGAGLLIWSLIPRFREGEFGGRFIVPIETSTWRQYGLRRISLTVVFGSLTSTRNSQMI